MTTTKLSDTQLTILSAASQRDDRAVILPERLTGGAADKVVKALTGRGLVEAVTATPSTPVWRESGDGRHLALVITNAGLEALGSEPEPAREEQPAPAAEPSEAAAPEAASPEAATPSSREGRGRVYHLG